MFQTSPGPSSGGITVFIHTYTYIHTLHRSMTSHKGHSDMKHCHLSGMITKISCHNTQNDIQQDNTQTYYI